MTRGIFHDSLFVRVGVAVLIATGCGPADDLTHGLQAEKSGDPGRAFDAYYSAAEKSPSSGRAVSGMRRVRGRAAADAESRALGAIREERFADAWLQLMRLLEIRPDHPEAPRMIRELEYDHPAAVEPARKQWIREGWKALALAPAHPVKDVQLAAAPTPAARLKERPTIASPHPPEVEQAEMPDKASAWRARRDVILPWNPAYQSPYTSSLRQNDRDARRQRRAAPSNNVAHRQARTPMSPKAPSPFVAVYTLSKHDNRYPRSVVAVDGIRIRLEDTDDDLEVDLNLYNGERRIMKIREIRIGQSEDFRGRSGRRYRLTLLAIQHTSRTAQIGIAPA